LLRPTRTTSRQAIARPSADSTRIGQPRTHVFRIGTNQASWFRTTSQISEWRETKSAYSRALRVAIVSGWGSLVCSSISFRPRVSSPPAMQSRPAANQLGDCQLVEFIARSFPYLGKSMFNSFPFFRSKNGQLGRVGFVRSVDGINDVQKCDGVWRSREPVPTRDTVVRTQDTAGHERTQHLVQESLGHFAAPGKNPGRQPVIRVGPCQFHGRLDPILNGTRQLQFATSVRCPKSGRPMACRVCQFSAYTRSSL